MEDVVRLPRRNKEVAAKELQSLLDLPDLSNEVYEVTLRCQKAAAGVEKGL